MHLAISLPTGVENGAQRRSNRSLDVVTTDGGYEVRNSRWSTPLRTFDVSMPNCTLTDPDYLAVKRLWEDSEGGLHTFDLFDWFAGERVKVRFDSPFQVTNTEGPFFHVDTFTLVEVRE